MTKEIIKPLATPDFVKELVEKIKEAVKIVDPAFELVVTDPDFSKTIGIVGNYLTTNVYSRDQSHLTANCVRISHLRHGGEGVATVVFDRVEQGEEIKAKVFVMGYVPEDDMDTREQMAVAGLNRGMVSLVDRISKLPEQVAQFMINNKMPTEK